MTTTSCAPDFFQASAPATIMLTGEHAVLRGQPALVAAIAKRLYVKLKPRTDRVVEIVSDRLGSFQTSVDKLSVLKPFHFVLGALKHFQDKMPSGCTLEIQSEFSHQVGFGSSAAITVSTVHVLSQWLKLSVQQSDIFNHARKVIQQIQGIGSGADVAASVYGNVVYYRKQPLVIEPLAHQPLLSLVYIGFKTPTPEVVRLVNKKEQEQPQHYHQLFERIGQCTERCKQAIANADWHELGQAFTEHQQLQVELGVSTDDIDELVQLTNQAPNILGTKISGSGLGDCIVCLGHLPKNYFPRNRTQRQNGVRQYDIQLSPYGVLTDRNMGKVQAWTN